MPTLREALAAAIPVLEAAGVETPRLDAELLLAHALGKSRTYLFAHPHAALPAPLETAFRLLVDRRCAREPLPYLLGTWEFMGLPFRVAPGVLIPRPETELLVEAVSASVRERARVLDVGVGSGCISISLARLLPRAEVVGLEPSGAALQVARANAGELGVAERVRFVQGSFPEAARPLGRFDAVASNPPYIPSAEVERLPPELRLYEPRLALDGGPDGLQVLRALATESPALLNPEGLLAVEVAKGQAGTVVSLLAGNEAWEQPEVLADLAGIPRVVLARRR